MVKTAPEGCSHYDTLAAMDELMWKMQNTEGVQSAVSMVSVARQGIKGMNEGSLKWETLSRNQHVLNNSIARAEGMYNSDCSLAPVLVFLNDHKAETLEHVVAAARISPRRTTARAWSSYWQPATPGSRRRLTR